MNTSTTAQLGSAQCISPDSERAAFIEAHRHLDLTEISDAWGQRVFMHTHVHALWDGWLARASLQPATPTGGEEPTDQRRLVDWVYLYALEGHGGWPDRHTITDPLIRLAASRAPTQEDADKLKAGATLKSFATPTAMAQSSAQSCSAGSEALGWPSLEVIAREIRRAMLDNPTDDSFNKRAEKREAIANEAAGIIMARFCAALPNAAQAGWMTIETAPKDGTPVLVWFRGRQHVAEYSAIWSKENMHWCVREPATGEHDISHTVSQIDPPTVDGRAIPGCWDGPSHWKPLGPGPSLPSTVPGGAAK